MVWRFSNRLGNWLGDFEEVGISPRHAYELHGASAEQLDRKMAIMCYLSVFGWLVAYRTPRAQRGSLTTFHVRQMSLVIGLSALIIVAQLAMLPFFGWSSMVVAGIGLGVMLMLRMLGVMGAISGLHEPLPLIGGLARRLLADRYM
ncbi:hypothetical protein B0919_21320 [Hymenobacter sp. CRA2]|nr:hypothetical protein B0919_21320 [Hymenobacter sp. CRA2]